MRIGRRELLLGGSAALVAGCQPKPAAEAADLILHGGQVLTVDAKFAKATAVAVKDGKFVAVGGPEILDAFQAPERIDLAGRTLMPGFTDAHVHIYSLAPRAIEPDKVKSIAELQDVIRAKAQELGKGEWITGYGWDEAQLAEKRNPLRSDLDKAAPDNPVVLTRAGAHSAVGNSLALQLAKITKATPDPQSGIIERDASGEPNGIIRERFDIIERLVPDDSFETLRASYIQAIKNLLPFGITSFHSASTGIGDEPVEGQPDRSGSGLTYRRMRAIYDEMGADLPRSTLYISFPGEARMKAFGKKSGDGDDRVRLGAIGENLVDGGFTGPTAWLLADYKGQPGFRGKGRFTDEQLQEMVDKANEYGWQMGLHAIGDAAIVQTVNAYVASLKKRPQQDHRWFLDHFTIMPPDATMQAMADNGIMIAQQPNFLYNLEGRYEGTLDDWRLAHNNSIATPVKKFGIHMAFSSDNLPIDPRVGLYAATTRKGPSGTVHGAEEAVTREEALRMYTANGPYLSWEEKTKGTLEAGKLADMVVLEQDPLKVADSELLTMNVDYTIVGGKVVYKRPEARA
jgi:predicted amidohydrolase YtcJ